MLSQELYIEQSTLTDDFLLLLFELKFPMHIHQFIKSFCINKLKFNNNKVFQISVLLEKIATGEFLRLINYVLHDFA